MPDHEVLDVPLGAGLTELLYDAELELRPVQEFFEQCSLARIWPEQNVLHRLTSDVGFRSHHIQIAHLLGTFGDDLDGSLLTNCFEKLRSSAFDARQSI